MSRSPFCPKMCSMSQDPLVGLLLGGTYRVVRLLGRGAMGAVYEARHEALSRTVALKVLAPEISAQPRAVQRLEREAQAAAQLGHPNIVPVTDFRAVPGEPAFLVMEYLQGKSLEQVMQESGRLQPSRVASMGIQVLDALAVAHRAGIVHRDIKPANLMVTAIPGAGEVVKILDFGVAKVTESHGLTRDGVLIGSPLFMAPEQAFHDVVDGRADLYALGATLYYAIAGVPPLEADSLPRMLSKLKDEAPVPLAQRCPQVDPALGAAIDRALLKHPDTRYASADDMKTALQRFALALSPSFSGAQVFALGMGGPPGPPPSPLAASPSGPYGPPPTTAAGPAGSDRYQSAPPAYGSPPGYAPGASGYGPPNPLAPGYGPVTTYGHAPAGAGMAAAVTGAPVAPPGTTMPSAAPVYGAGAAPATKKSGAGLAVGLGLGILLLAGLALGGVLFLRDGGTGAALQRPSTGTAASVPSGSILTTTAPSASGSVAVAPTSTGTAPGVVPPLPSASRGGPPQPVVPPTPTASASASVQPTPTPTVVPPVAPGSGPWVKSCSLSQGPTYDDTEAVRAYLPTRASSLNRCAPQACFRHDKSQDVGYSFDYFTAELDLQGNVTSARNEGSGCPALYACVVPVVRTWKFPKPLRVGPVTFTCGFLEARPPH